jgi:predicted XRE-type DNA-binding protein
MSRRSEVVTVGTGNVFADLGLPDGETHYLKARLVSEIMRAARTRKLTQTGLGKVIGVSQPEVSRMYHGHFREYSVERLMHFLTVLDHEIEILIRPRPPAGRKRRIAVKAVAA